MNLFKHRDTVPLRPLAPQGQGAILRFTEEMRCDLWADTSTLYTSIVRGHMPIGAAKAAEVVATGVLYIHPRDFLKQLRTLSVDAPTAAGRSLALARFGKFFLRSLWDVYAERVA